MPNPLTDNPLYTWAKNIGAFVTEESQRQFNADTAGQPFRASIDRYAENEKYYDNTMYDIVNNYGSGTAKARRGLYRNIRPIRNPLRRAIDWYPGKLYPGAMTEDGSALPDGTPSCLPFAADTPEEVRLAFSQAFEWGNFGSLRYQFGRSLPTLGDQFGEVEIDYARNKVYPVLVHPGLVVDANWNGSGDLTMYRLNVPMIDPITKKPYRWGKRVDAETITTYYNDEPHGYDGQPATIPNPWGFVPAAWCQFRNVGGQHGAALSDGVRAKVDELNHLLSPIHDYIGKFVNQGIFISGTNRRDFETANESRISAQPTANDLNPQARRESLAYMFGPKDTTFHKLIDNLGLGESDSHVQRQIQEIEADLPEATIDEQIQKFRQPPSGEALKQMFGNVEPRVFEAQGNGDNFWVTLGQMCLSIGGELANGGAWGKRSQLTEAQQKFLPFDLGSYDANELDVTWLPRPLFANSRAEKIAAAAAIEALKTPTALRMADVPDEDIFGPLAAGVTAYPRLGILAEQQGAAQASSDRVASAFNSGAGL